MALPTAAQIRALNLPNISGTGEDTYLGTVISAANQALADHCLFPVPASGLRTLEATSHILYLDGPSRDDDRVLVLGLRPIVSVTSIKQDTAGVWSYATTETAYTADLVSGLVYANAGGTLAWGCGLRHIQATVVAGFDVGAHPVLTMAIGLMVSTWMAGRAPTPYLDAQTADGTSQTYRDGQIPAAVRALVSPYRLVERETH